MDWKLHLHNPLSIFVLLTSLSTVIAVCKIPNLANVNVLVPEWASRSSRTVKHMAIINFECKPGYEQSSGDTDAICVQQKLKHPQSSKRTQYLRCSRKKCQVQDLKNGQYRLAENKAYFKCDHGYYLNGSSIIQCVLNENEDFSLETDPPTCDPLSQCLKPNIANSQILNECCSEGDIVKIQCNMGYEIKGNDFLKCLSSGHWNDTLPECDYVATCKEPGIPLHGNYSGSCCRAGSVLKYYCDEGFEFENPNRATEIKCLDSEKWSAPRPKCKPKGNSTCEIPDFEDRNLEIVYEKRPQYEDKLEVYLSDSEVEFKCKDGYENNGSDFQLFCNEGNWDVDLPFCLASKPCKRPVEPRNGKIAELQSDDREEFPVGFEINFECNEGYRIKFGEYGSSCLGNNIWSGGPIPNCTIITCSDPGRPENGNREGDSFKYGDQVKFSCHSSYKLLGSATRVCQLNGQWSGELTICDKGDTYCPNPGIPINSYRKGKSFELGEEVTFACKRGFYMTGNRTRKCLEDHSWSGEEVFCKGSLEFTKIEDASNVLEETMAVAARMTTSSAVIAGMGRGLVDFQNANGINIIFVFDGSGSIKMRSFERAQLFAEALIRKVGLSVENEGTRMAAILFSSDVKVIFQASEVETISEALEKLKEMVPQRQGTDIRKALAKVAEVKNLAETLKGRSKSKSVAFLFTDGHSNEGGDPEADAKKLIEDHDVELFCITIGTNVNGELIKRIVPSEKHIIHLANYNELFQVISYITDEKTDYSKCGLGHSNYVKPTGIGRIIGGKKVKRSWPWMTSLKYRTEHKCGGSIIHNKWILTAAHCFKSEEIPREQMENYIKPVNWKAHVGMVEELTNDVVTFSHSFDVPISDIYLHDKYESGDYDFDIALLKLKMPLTFDLFMRPICLPPRYADLPDGINLYQPLEEATVVGWGFTERINPNVTTKAKAVEHALEVVLPLQSRETCSPNVQWKKCTSELNCITFNQKVTENMICAGNADGKKDTCSGDSGGPLMQQSLSSSGNWTETRWFEVGIVSWGVGCALKGFYGYYTHAAMLREWIDITTQEQFENAIPIADLN